MSEFILQQTTNNVRFTFSVGDTTRVILPTQDKSCDHDMVRAQKKASKDLPSHLQN